jgi:hypothetical protein
MPIEFEAEAHETISRDAPDSSTAMGSLVQVHLVEDSVFRRLIASSPEYMRSSFFTALSTTH